MAERSIASSQIFIKEGRKRDTISISVTDLQSILTVIKVYRILYTAMEGSLPPPKVLLISVRTERLAGLH